MPVFIPQDTMFSLCGGNSHTKKYLGMLVKEGLIKVEKLPKKGENPTGWMPGDNWLDKNLIPSTVKSPKIASILSDYEFHRSRMFDWQRCHHHWVKMFPRIGLDEEKARSVLSKMKRGLPVYRPDTHEQAKQRHKHRQSQAAVEKILVGHPRSTLGESGRFFTTFNQMPKELRHITTIDGKPIVERDIASFSPYVLALLYRVFHIAGVKFIQSPRMILPKLFAPSGPLHFASLKTTPNLPPELTESLPDTPPFIMFYPDASSVPKNTMPSNVVDLIEIEESGEYWDAAKEAMGFRRKSYAKKAICSLHYGPHGPKFHPEDTDDDRQYRQKKWNRRWDRYAKWQPEIAAMVEWLKTDDYRDVIALVMQIESAIMVRFAGEALRTWYPHIACLGIHDGIGTTEEYVDTIDSIIYMGFWFLGGNPHIK
jgi:hypothetical protein